MKQGQIITACHSLDKLMDQDISLALAKKVFDMREKLQPAWNFQVRQEEKIAGKYPNVDPGKLSVQYDTGNAELEKERLAELDGFIKELKELSEMEQEIDVEPITIYVDQENIKMAGKDIKALKGFITFE